MARGYFLTYYLNKFTSMPLMSLVFSDYGKRLEQIMSDRKITIDELAFRTDIGPRSIRRMRKGEIVGAEKLALVADFLNTSLDWLMFGRGRINNSSQESVEVLDEYYNATQPIKDAARMVLRAGVSRRKTLPSSHG